MAVATAANSGIPVKLILQSEGADAVATAFNELANNLNRITALANQAGAAADKLQAGMGQAASQTSNAAGQTANLAKEANAAAGSVQGVTEQTANLSEQAANAAQETGHVAEQVRSIVPAPAHQLVRYLSSASNVARTVSNDVGIVRQGVTALAAVPMQALNRSFFEASVDIERMTQSIRMANGEYELMISRARSYELIIANSHSSTPQQNEVESEPEPSKSRWSKFKEISKQLQDVAAPLQEFGQDAIKVAGNFEQLTIQLENVTHSSARAQAVFETAESIARSTPFDVQGLATAATNLERFGQNAQAILPQVADLAAGSGKSIQETAAAVAKAMNGASGGFDNLINSFGVSVTHLAAHGAKLDKAGHVMTGTAEQIEAARRALSEVIGADYVGAAEKQADSINGAISSVEKAIEHLKAEIGEAIAPMVTQVANAISSLIDYISQIPSWVFEVVGVLGGVVVALSAVSAAIVSVGTAAVGLVTAISGIAAAFSWWAIAIGLVVAAIVGVYAHCENEIKIHQEAAKEIEKQTKSMLEQTRAYDVLSKAMKDAKSDHDIAQKLQFAGLTEAQLAEQREALVKEREALKDSVASGEESDLNRSKRYKQLTEQVKEYDVALTALRNDEEASAEAAKLAKEEAEKKEKAERQAAAERERANKEAVDRQKSLNLSLLEAELRTLEQRKQVGDTVDNAILVKRKELYAAKLRIIEEEYEEEINLGVKEELASAEKNKKIAALDEQYHQEELRRAKETADAKQRIEAEARKKREAEIEKQAQERVEYLRDQTSSASSKSPNEQLNALREQIKLYQRALVADKQLLKSEKAREAAQKDLNSLKEREVKLVEQIAEIQKQADEQNEQLAKDLLEEELSTLEQRKAAGENVEQAIAAKREEIHQAKLTQIDEEKQEQIKSGVEVEKADEAARLKRAALDEQEKRRKLADIAEIKKASEPAKPQPEAEKKEAEYNSIRKQNQAKGILSLDDVLSEYNARDAAWKAKLAEPFGESSASKTLADSSAAAAASVSGLSDNAKTASESIKVLGMCAAATVGSANVTTGINADANKTGAASANSKAASEPAKATSATVQVTPANANDASKTSESSASGFMSVLSNLSAAVGSILGGFTSFESAVTSAASALETLASSAAAAGSNVSAGYAASSALISGDFISSPLAMPTPGSMGAVNPSVLGASSLESGGNTTNTTNNFYMDDTRVAQSVTAEQVMRGVESMMAIQDAWAKMYAGPWR
ncbi:MAG: hypothetical protein K6G50_06020 [bacterium]|nr:hypothetical protein [bacterium]